MDKWYDDYADDGEDDLQVEEYDITSAPNDFNVLTINSFIESGAVRIPGFQRNYVWDINRASKLIESLILGLPVPQVFLYEVKRNEFFVIDGQQRLMSIYYFIKQRFPKREMRSALRDVFAQFGHIPANVLHDDTYFENFRLKLPETLPNRPSRFKDIAYSTLGEYKSQFDLRTIRNVIIKQNVPTDDDSSMYEVFNRLNTGGINLKPQEIRMSMYHSAFYEVLYKVNLDPRWRHLLGSPTADVHMKDIEILLRAFGLLLSGDDYRPSMVRFLNQFSRKMRSNTDELNSYLGRLVDSFLGACAALPNHAFSRNGRFNVAIFEATFVAVSSAALVEQRMINGQVTEQQLKALEDDAQFVNALTQGTTKTENVKRRLGIAKAILGGF